MVSGGRNLENEIMESFFEKISRDESIPDDFVEEVERIERRNELTDATEIVESAKEVMTDAHSENRD